MSYQRLVQRWQECYSGCDLRDLFAYANQLKELLKSHPSPEVRNALMMMMVMVYVCIFSFFKGCPSLIDEVKKEYRLERDVNVNKLREVAGKRFTHTRKENN